MILNTKPATNEVTQQHLSVYTLEDDVVRRAIAKVAFNYVAKTRGVESALSTDFDGIRQYIRFGKIGEITYVQQVKPPKTA